MIDLRERIEVRPTSRHTAPLVQPATKVAGSISSPLVLVVEDHPSIRTMLSCVLDLQGFQTACATNGLEALMWLESAHHTGVYPSVILLDLVMPVMNGEVFLERLRASWQAPVPVPPIILFTVDQGDHVDLACSEVLSKPFHIKDLLEKLERVTRDARSSRCCQV